MYLHKFADKKTAYNEVRLYCNIVCTVSIFCLKMLIFLKRLIPFKYEATASASAWTRFKQWPSPPSKGSGPTTSSTRPTSAATIVRTAPWWTRVSLQTVTIWRSPSGPRLLIWGHRSQWLEMCIEFHFRFQKFQPILKRSQSLPFTLTFSAPAELHL